MLQINKALKTPYYIQIYTYYRSEIEERRMPAGMRLASVRELARAINVSKMTVEKAYYQLASEGYIIRRNKARYEIASLGCPENPPEVLSVQQNDAVQRPAYRYDFASGDMDMERFPIDVWRKYMNRVLSEPVYLQSCQDEQGVPDLRDALSHYVYETRGVHADRDNIIIGAGTAALLGVLTHILKPVYPRIGVENPGFRLGREIFRSTGYEIVPLPMKQGLMDMEALTSSDVRLVYVSPSHQFPTGTVMPAGMRHSLLQWARERDGLIIEDDYDSELRYYGRPVPALQGLDTTGQVVYMGALSKVLPFFVRLSYMVLPPRLMKLYNQERSLFRQGASVPEQCVLASYIRSGELSRQVRRLRKDYQEKGQLMQELLLRAFGEDITMSRIVSGVYCHIQLHSPYTEKELRRRAERHGCRVLSMQSFYETRRQGNEKEFLLSFSKISSRELKQAVESLHDAWTEKEGA
jgi:GntR family transcriptional regulator/MocR family aminotransferase